MSVIEQNNAQIERLRSAIAEAYAACDEKEATMPSDEVIANLASCIRSIQHGIPDGYVNFTHYYTNEHTQTTSSTLETSYTFNCGFKPKVVLISLHTDTTLTTVNGIVFAFRSNIDGLTSVGDGLYKLSTSNRLGAYGGGLSVAAFTDTGFTYSHGSIGFAKGVTYDIYAWG